MRRSFVTPEMATLVPHKTRQLDMRAPEKEEDPTGNLPIGSPQCQSFYFLTIIFLTKGLPSISSRYR